MNDQIMSPEEIATRCKRAFDYFSRLEYQKRSNWDSMILITIGLDARSYYIMEGYTDDRIFLNLREMFRKFRDRERIACTQAIIDGLVQTGLELAMFCLRSHYDLVVELCLVNQDNDVTVIALLQELGYQPQRVVIGSSGYPYQDIDPYDCVDILTQELCDQMVVYWIQTASRLIR